MSRAFVKEDDQQRPKPKYDLPDPESDYYEEAAALALLEGANQGDTKSAETATGYRWGEPRLVPHVKAVLEKAREEEDYRAEQLAKRFLRAAKRLE